MKYHLEVESFNKVHTILLKMGDSPVVFCTAFVLLFSVVLIHLWVAPFTKVEESFALQATHDLLFHPLGPSAAGSPQLFRNVSNFDHISFPGVVPRTFIGPLALSFPLRPLAEVLPRAAHSIITRTCSQEVLPPLLAMYICPQLVASSEGAASIAQYQALVKPLFQFLVRAMLGLHIAVALASLCRSVSAVFGRTASRFFLLFCATQFHLMFYATRTLPNTFALVLTCYAFSWWLRGASSRTSVDEVLVLRVVKILAFAGLVFRSELAALAVPILLDALIRLRVSFWKLFFTGLQASIWAIAASVLVDSYFWQRWLWPEAEVLWFNTVDNRSSEWGTSPIWWYFAVAIPKAIMFPIMFLPLGMALDRRALSFSYTSLIFVALYSLLPHKELRFVLYAIPVMTVVCAVGAARVWNSFPSSKLRSLVRLMVIGTIVAAAAGSGLLLLISSWNYPGGVALAKLHSRFEPSSEQVVRVHIDVPAAMTGVSRFGETGNQQFWTYSKDEEITSSQLFEAGYTHALSAQETIPGFKVVDKADGFSGINLGALKDPKGLVKTLIRERSLTLIRLTPQIFVHERAEPST